jgi:hypothetical protein
MNSRITSLNLLTAALLSLFLVSLSACNGGSTGTSTTGSGDTDAEDPIAAVTVSEFNPYWLHVGVFEPATTCASCHQSDGVIMTFNGKDVSPYSQWKHSVMAHSFNDPYWQAAVEDESAAFPGLEGVIEDKCMTCHAPMAHTNAHQTLTNLEDGNLVFDTARDLDHAREGVSCTLCHQINDSNINDANELTGAHDDRSFSGAYSIDPASQEIGGPYTGPSTNPMLNQSGYTPKYDALTQKSEICATCHTLYTPVVDVETGMPNGEEFLEQAPFLEWLNSNYATGNGGVAVQQCQDCHMPQPADTYSTPISTRPSSAPVRTPFTQHSFLGGNAHLLDLLRTYSTALGIANSTTSQGFQDQADMTRSFIGQRAAELNISAANIAGGTLFADAVITNKAGHKLPSSYPSRRMWLHVTVRDGASGNVIFESGKPDSNGRISTDSARLQEACMELDKPDGFDSSACFEPHRDVINSADQVAIYETVLGDTHDVITHTLLRASEYLKDNRIPPAGFTEEKAEDIEEQTKASGDVEDDPNFNCHDTAEGCGEDTVRYQVNVNGLTGPFTIEAELLYQSVQPAFVDGLHSDGALVKRFKAMYEAVPPSVEVLATASVSGVN